MSEASLNDARVYSRSLQRGGENILIDFFGSQQTQVPGTFEFQWDTATTYGKVGLLRAHTLGLLQAPTLGLLLAPTLGLLGSHKRRWLYCVAAPIGSTA